MLIGVRDSHTMVNAKRAGRHALLKSVVLEQLIAPDQLPQQQRETEFWLRRGWCVGVAPLWSNRRLFRCTCFSFYYNIYIFSLTV